MRLLKYYDERKAARTGYTVKIVVRGLLTTVYRFGNMHLPPRCIRTHMYNIYIFINFVISVI